MKMMKGLLAVVIAAIVVLGMACGGGGSSPSSVVKTFYAAAAKGDLAVFDKTCTPETAAFLKAFAGEEKFKTQMQKGGKVTNTVETIDGDTAKVVVSFENIDDQTIDLVKVDGKWKISIKK